VTITTVTSTRYRNVPVGLLEKCLSGVGSLSYRNLIKALQGIVAHNEASIIGYAGYQNHYLGALRSPLLAIQAK